MTLTRAELVALDVLADGEWHRCSRIAGADTVLVTPSVSLHRLGLVERRGQSRGPRPQASGFEYRLTSAGREVLEPAPEPLGPFTLCPAHLVPEPCATCSAYIAAGL